jgi:hypothetical protein
MELNFLRVKVLSTEVGLSVAVLCCSAGFVNRIIRADINTKFLVKLKRKSDRNEKAIHYALHIVWTVGVQIAASFAALLPSSLLLEAEYKPKP